MCSFVASLCISALFRKAGFGSLPKSVPAWGAPDYHRGMDILAILLLIIAFICFVLAAINFPAKRFNLVALGLAFWVASILLGHVHIG